jgi:hypothetical protein
MNNLLFILLTLVINKIATLRTDSYAEASMLEAKVVNALAGANMTSLSIQAGEANNAEFILGCTSDYYSFTNRGKYSDFILSAIDKPLMSTNKDNDIMFFPKYINAKKGLNFTGDFKVKGIPQWRLLYEDDFTGWSNNTTTECGGITMLGGYCVFGGGEVTKTFKDLPTHTSIRIQANYHFIDAWNAETGFMRINNGKDGMMQYIWTERYSAFIGNYGIDVCGGRWPEGRFSTPIDVSIPHTDSSVKIGFGSTIEQDPCDESFGVSGVRILIR